MSFIDIHSLNRVTEDSLLLKYRQEAFASWPAHESISYTIVPDEHVLGFAEQRAMYLSRGKGEYVGSLDDDDRVDTALMIELIEHVEAKRPLVIQTARMMINREGKPVRQLTDSVPECTLETVSTGKSSMMHLVLARSDLAQEACYHALRMLDGMPIAYRDTFDMVYFLELLKLTPCIKWPKPVYQWRFHGAMQMHQQCRHEMAKVLTIYARQLRQQA
jgi:hypothetical protein